MNSKSLLCQPLFGQMFVQNNVSLVLRHLSGYTVDNPYSPDMELLLFYSTGTNLVSVGFNAVI